jgi:hypothetical protein
VPINVRLAAHNGLKSDTGACPKCADSVASRFVEGVKNSGGRRRDFRVEI